MDKIKPEIINKNVWSRLTKIQKNNQLSGSYFFVGSKGLGKFEMAFNFIELNEDFKDKRKLIESGLHSDVVIVKPEIEEKKGKTKEKQISVEQIQEALKKFSYRSESSCKFLLINGVDKLTLTAANSLLKIIEELQEGQVAILLASNEGSVLDTIKSRCQRIYFNLKSEKEIEKDVELINGRSKVHLNDHLIRDIVFLARGRIKEVEKLLEDEDYRKDRIEKLNNFRQALKGDLKTGFQIANEDTKDKKVFEEYLTDWNYYLSSFLKRNIEEDKDIRIQKKVFEILKNLNEAQGVLNSNKNANIRLLLENFFVQIK